MSKPSYGVIVGRFQVHKLHAGHEELFRAVMERHSRVIVFLGIPAHQNMTKKHPLPFEVRKRMLESRFPDADLILLPLVDVPDDDNAWSDKLDSRIREVAPIGDVTLYSSRDGFAASYHGHFKVRELLDLEINVPFSISGEKVRAEITNTVMASPEFRAGIIWAHNHMWDKVIACVDIALCHVTETSLMVCLGKKPGEKKWRFFGGHAETSTSSYAADAKKEAGEEAHAFDISHIFCIGDTKVDDPRWRGENDVVKTNLYIGLCPSMAVQADDDMKGGELRWFDIKELSIDKFMEEHHPLFEIFATFLAGADMVQNGNVPAPEAGRNLLFGWGR